MNRCAPVLRRVISLAFAMLAAGLPSRAMNADPLRQNADALAQQLADAQKLPAPPPGVTDLRFRDFFILPAGPEGLTLRETVRALDGRRVRLLGFMVRQQRPVPGLMLLAPFPLATLENEYGLADDLPPNVVFVSVPKYADVAVPFTPGPLLLTGTLRLGAREEADGRVSHLRLQLDDAPSPASAAAALSSP